MVRTHNSELRKYAPWVSWTLHKGRNVSFEEMNDMLLKLLEELEEKKDKLSLDSHRGYASIEIEDLLHSFLYLLVMSTKIQFTENEKDALSKLTYKLNKLNLTTTDGSTILHLCLNVDTPVLRKFHMRKMCKFPCASTARMLLQCGANVNARDNEGNTPLHIIAKYDEDAMDSVTFDSIINELLQYGGHIDCVNNDGETPVESTVLGMTEMVLCSYKINLQCLAARAVLKFNIVYENKLSPTLKAFVDMHGAPQ